MAKKKARKRNIVEAELFVVKDEHGNWRGTFGIEYGNTRLRIFDSKRVKRVDVSVNENDESGIFVYDQSGDDKVFLSVRPDGTTTIELKNCQADLATKPTEHEPEEDFASNLRGFLLVSYIADVAGQLHPDKKLKLTHLGEQYGTDDWQATIEQDFGIKKKQIATLLKTCRTSMSDYEAILFIARGFNCPDASERVSEVMNE